jgi:hypothetical protein
MGRRLPLIFCGTNLLPAVRPFGVGLLRFAILHLTVKGVFGACTINTSSHYAAVQPAGSFLGATNFPDTSDKTELTANQVARNAMHSSVKL